MVRKISFAAALLALAACAGCGAMDAISDLSWPDPLAKGESHPKNAEGNYGWADSGYFSGQEGQTLRGQANAAAKGDNKYSQARAEENIQRHERQMTGTHF